MRILAVGTYRGKTWPRGRLDPLEQLWGGSTVSQPCARDHHAHHHAQRSPQQRALAPVALLAALIATLATAPLRGLDRWAIEARGTGCGLPPRLLASLGSPGVQQPGPRAIAPPREVIVHGALGPSSVRQHVPLPPAPIQIQDGRDDFAPGHLARAAPTVGLGCGHQRCQHSPRGVRQIRGRRLAGRLCLRHGGALRYQ